MSRHPELMWAQRKDKVFLTVLLPDAKDAKVNLDPEGVFSFSGKAGSGNNLYEIKLELFDKVNVEESKVNIGVRNIFCILEKAEKVWWKKLLRGDGKQPHYVKVDWDKWVDEDEDNGMDNLNLGGMDFSKFGGMGGDMGDDFEDSDDEEVMSKPTDAAAAAGVSKMEEEETEGNEGEEKATAAGVSKMEEEETDGNEGEEKATAST